MSVFQTHTSPPRFSLTRTLVAAAVLTGVFLLARPDSRSQATVSQGVPAYSEIPSVTPFAKPVAVLWEGMVTRTLAGGRGLEIKSAQAEGGYFFAYDDAGFSSSLSEGPVLVTGTWIGTSCEYGRCAPEVEAESVSPAPIVLE